MGRPVGSKNKTTTIKDTKPEVINKVLEERNEFWCCRCPREFTKQRGNFPASQSPLYENNNKFLPICNHCLDELFNHYTVVLGSEEESIRRLCMKFDIYYNDSIVKASRKVNANYSRIKAYISKANLNQYRDKTYDTTIEEETTDTINSIEDIKESDIKIPQKTVRFFGVGFSPEDYKFLQEQYDDWTARHECKTKAQEELFKTICMSQLNILETQRNGGKITEAMSAFQGLLGSANLKPNQTNSNALADQNTLGTLIKKWENEKPVPEPDPEWKDVDGIVRYINVYFLGHLCKMMGIKNSYSRMYEEEMAKYKVDKPQYESDDEALFDAVFSSNIEGDEHVTK